MSIFRKLPINIVKEEIAAISLSRTLNVYDLIMLGIGAIIGVGAFVLTGIAAAKFAGPSITLSYIIAGFICLLVGLLYVELASLSPSSGSSYTFAYISMGEFIAWMVFWFMMMEYTTGSGMIAVGFGGYFLGIFESMGYKFPSYLNATPFDGGIMNLPAFIVVWLVTALLTKGTKESSMLNIALVIVKVAAILVFIFIAIPHFNLDNWKNFMPYGYPGIATGTATLVLAYAGFDQLASATEEAKNPKRDLPIAMFASLAFCAVMYVGIAASLTLIVPYNTLDNSEPMAYALRVNGSNIGSTLIAIGALAGIITSLIVQIYGQSRSLFAISRDGMLPKFMSKIHKKYHTPFLSTYMTGFVVSLVAAFIPLEFISKLSNVGSLVAFISVALGVLILRKTHPNTQRGFRCPAVYLVAPLALISCSYLLYDLLKTALDMTIAWAVIGCAIYFVYGYRHSILSDRQYRQSIKIKAYEH
ncbi:MAG: amino acid permease [Alphaproteobacteria bacterium 33-17]|nr:MAG: amino acid permease [Alphaproteobacteria bacterium 33-17]